MSAITRESYAAAANRLSALDEDAPALATIGGEILAVAEMLAREPRLRRALADPARTGEHRAALLGELLSGKVSPGARELLTALVRGRWSTAAELLVAAERLGVDALLASAGEAGARGRSAAEPSVKRPPASESSEASDAVSKTGVDVLGDVEDELFRFGQIVSGDPALASALGDSTTDSARRATLVRALLDGRAHPITVRLAEQAIAGFGGRSFAGALSRLVELTAERRDREVAYVTVAFPLADADETRLGDRLSALYGRKVSVKVTVDPTVLGGIRVRIGDDLYDGTVARRLAETHHALAGRPK